MKIAAYEALSRIFVDDYHPQTVVQDAQFPYDCHYRLGTNKSRSKAKHNLSQQVWKGMAEILTNTVRPASRILILTNKSQDNLGQDMKKLDQSEIKELMQFIWTNEYTGRRNLWQHA